MSKDPSNLSWIRILESLLHLVQNSFSSYWIIKCWHVLFFFLQAKKEPTFFFLPGDADGLFFFFLCCLSSQVPFYFGVFVPNLFFLYACITPEFIWCLNQNVLNLFSPYACITPEFLFWTSFVLNPCQVNFQSKCNILQSLYVCRTNASSLFCQSGEKTNGIKADMQSSRLCNSTRPQGMDIYVNSRCFF